MQEFVSADTKKKSLESALFKLSQTNGFFGALLTELNIRYDSNCPAIGGISYKKKEDKFVVLLNPELFCTLDIKQRVAVLHHEVLHFSHQHLFRFDFEENSPELRKIANLGADMAINQYILDLPKGTVDVKDWKLPTGQPFPLHKTFEEYYQLLKQDSEDNKKGKSKNKEMWDKLAQPEGQDLDVHEWEELSPEEKERMLREAKRVVERTVEKTQFGHSQVPDAIKDLLQELDATLSKINYKGILKRAIKRTVSSVDRENTWKRSNKRYGSLAPGSTLGKLPMLSVYVDTSGSISHTELNQFLSILDGFLKVGSRKCKLGFWHTDLYQIKPYKLGNRVVAQEIESGGTDVTCVMMNIKKTNPNLALILTDGYFSMPEISVNSEVIWIVSEGGNKSQNYPDNHKVISLDKIIK